MSGTRVRNAAGFHEAVLSLSFNSLSTSPTSPSQSPLPDTFPFPQHDVLFCHSSGIVPRPCSLLRLHPLGGSLQQCHFSLIPTPPPSWMSSAQSSLLKSSPVSPIYPSQLNISTCMSHSTLNKLVLSHLLYFRIFHCSLPQQMITFCLVVYTGYNLGKRNKEINSCLRVVVLLFKKH